MSPSPSDLSLQYQGRLCFREGIGFHLAVKEMPPGTSAAFQLKLGWLPVVI